MSDNTSGNQRENSAFADLLKSHTDFTNRDKISDLGGTGYNIALVEDCIEILKLRFQFFNNLILSTKDPQEVQHIKDLFKKELEPNEEERNNLRLDRLIDSIIRRSMSDAIKEQIEISIKEITDKNLLHNILIQSSDNVFLNFLQENTLRYGGKDDKLTAEDLRPFIDFARDLVNERLQRLREQEESRSLQKFKDRVKSFFIKFTHTLNSQQIAEIYNQITAGRFNPEFDAPNTPYDFEMEDFLANKDEVLHILEEISQDKIKKEQQKVYEKADPLRTKILEELRYSLSSQMTMEEVNELLKHASVQNLIKFLEAQKDKDEFYDGKIDEDTPITDKQITKYYEDIMDWIEKWKEEYSKP